MRSYIGVLLVAAFLATLAWACSSSSSTGGTDGPDTGVIDTGTVDGNPDSTCALTCSEDRRQVLDCNGAVVTTCAPDEGCAGGACVSSCASAADAKTSMGCDFYAVAPDSLDEGIGACLATVVVNTWTSDATLSVEWEGAQLDLSTFAYTRTDGDASVTYTPLTGGKLPAGQTAVLFLNRVPGGAGSQGDCPLGTTAATTVDITIHGTGRGKAFHINADRPVAAYELFPFNSVQLATGSTTLLLPTSTWGNGYVAMTAYKDTALNTADPFFQIVGTTDGSRVTIRSAIAILGSDAGVDPIPDGGAHEYTVNKGEVLQIEQPEDVSGAIVTSDKPVGVWGGHSCLNIPVDLPACDIAHQHLPPVAAFGHEYVAVRYRNRVDAVDGGAAEEAPPWRLAGAANGTTLTYEPSAPPGAPTTLEQGQVAEISSSGPWVVRSQDKDHPFYMSAHMTGANAVSSRMGDPEFVNVIPTAQFLRSYTFFLDTNDANTSLVVVRSKATDGTFKDVTLDCGGNLAGWTAVGGYEFTRLDLKRDGTTVTPCGWGKHTVQSDAPFTATAWGWDLATSYAYPIGASVQALVSESP